MLQFMDRLAIAVPDANTAIESCEDLFGCVVVDEIFDREGCARRVALQLGKSLLELLEPRGPGPVLDFIEQGRRGVFGIGFAVTDPALFASTLSSKGLVVYTQSPRRFVVFPDDCRGSDSWDCWNSGFIINKLKFLPPVGLVRGITRITCVVADLPDTQAYFSWLLDLDSIQDERCATGTNTGKWVIARFDIPSEKLHTSLELITSGQENNDAGWCAGDDQPGVCRVTVQSDRFHDIQNRATQNGFDWRASPKGGLLCLPCLNGLILKVVDTEISPQIADQRRVLGGSS